MNITREEIAQAVKAVIDFLDKEKISSLQDLKRINCITHPVDKAEGIIEVRQTLSNFGTIAQTVSYGLPGRGIPLDIKVNGDLKYSAITYKGDLIVPGYALFAQDPFGNNVYHKKIASIDFSDIRSELEQLANNESE